MGRDQAISPILLPLFVIPHIVQGVFELVNEPLEGLRPPP